MRLPTGIQKAWKQSGFLRNFATITNLPPIPQTVIEKVVQKYAVDLADGRKVKAGDYVMIRPEHVMTHDNTGPVISKCATNIMLSDYISSFIQLGSNPSELPKFRILLSQYLP